MMQKAGVGALQDELAALVNADLTPMQALKTATRNPAEFLGQLDKVGPIERGKLADIVLLDANPLDDIHNTSRVSAVILFKDTSSHGSLVLSHSRTRSQLQNRVP